MGIYKYLTKNISKGTKERKEIKKIIHFNNIVKNSLINTFTLHTINYILLDGCLLKIFSLYTLTDLLPTTYNVIIIRYLLIYT